MFKRGGNIESTSRLVYLGYSNEKFVVICENNGIANKFIIQEDNLFVQGDSTIDEIRVLTNTNLSGVLKSVTLLVPPNKTINI